MAEIFFGEWTHERLQALYVESIYLKEGTFIKDNWTPCNVAAYLNTKL